ncbi:hypothetical protein BS78_03G360500 [Paspalum vaginatum]|nr:hypothetical protein BS78_03G360500 [Paspalum vaginatum]
MPQTRVAADAFGVLTIALFALFAALGLFCIFQSVYFRCRIQRGPPFLPLGYFNGPWVTRIALILITIWWGVGEIVRLSFLKRKLFSSLAWQRNICDVYILSNLGFAEPGIFFAFALLLHGSLQKRELGTLNQRWNWKTMAYMLVFCIPVFFVQAILVFVGPKFVRDENIEPGRRKIAKYFIRTSMPVGDTCVCTYPLFGTIFLGLVDAVLMSYVSYIGSRVLSLVINKALRRRVSLLMLSVLCFLPIRVLLLGFSVLPKPGDVAFEGITFLSFFAMLTCTTVGILLLVYYPVADSLALRDIGQREIAEMVPYDDYYYEGASSLVANQSFREIERNSDTSTKRGSISFRTMIREDQLQQDVADEIGFSSRSGVHIGSPSGSSPSAAMPMLPLKEIPRY